MTEFNSTKALESMDIAWLQANGWTLPANLAYRHILHEFAQSRSISRERIEQILMQHDVVEHREKIISELKELIQLGQDLRGDRTNG